MISTNSIHYVHNDLVVLVWSFNDCHENIRSFPFTPMFLGVIDVLVVVIVVCFVPFVGVVLLDGMSPRSTIRRC